MPDVFVAIMSVNCVSRCVPDELQTEPVESDNFWLMESLNPRLNKNGASYC